VPEEVFRNYSEWLLSRRCFVIRTGPDAGLKVRYLMFKDARVYPQSADLFAQQWLVEILS
jgi:hypothetical protein